MYFPAPGAHDVHVDLGGGVLGVVEVQARQRVDDPDRDRRAQVGEWVRGHLLRRDEPRARVVQREIPAADGRRTGPTVGLQGVAVDRDLDLSEDDEIRHRAATGR